MARWPWRRKRQQPDPPRENIAGPDETRPRYGRIEHADGNVTLLVFHPTVTPGMFAALRADDLAPARLGEGDRLHVDVVGPGQGIAINVDEGGGSGA